MVKEWLGRSDSLNTDIGYDLFERIITANSVYRKAVDAKLTTATQ